MKNTLDQFGLNGSATENTEFSVPLSVLLFNLFFLGNVRRLRVRHNAIIDPFTGQQICMRPASNRQPRRECAKRRISSRIVESAWPTATFGSGTLVARDQSVGLVLTVRICSMVPRPNRRHISEWRPDSPRDSSIWIVPTTWQPLQFAGQKSSRSPQASERSFGILTACGFGPNGVFRCIRGGITGHPTAVGASHPSHDNRRRSPTRRQRRRRAQYARPNRRRRLGPARWLKPTPRAAGPSAISSTASAAGCSSTVSHQPSPQPPAPVPNSIGKLGQMNSTLEFAHSTQRSKTKATICSTAT